MEAETKISLVITAAVIALTFLIMLVAIVSLRSRRRLLENENKLQRIEKKQQLELFRATVKAEENLKASIAANLHDEVIPTIAFAVRNLKGYTEELHNEGVNVYNIQHELHGLSRVVDTVREISHNLTPQLFASRGLLGSLESVVNGLNREGSASVTFLNNTNFTQQLPFSIDNQLLIYRICLEILNNLEKHGKYQELAISLENNTDGFFITFVHNGTSVTNREMELYREASPGLGLKTMHSRAMLIKGKIDYFSELGVSYVRLFVPFKNEREN